MGQRIRQLRKSRHLTQADLASRIGITQSDLSRMESGEYKVGLDTLFKILHVFELSMSRFFEEAPEPQEVHEPVEAGEEVPEREQLLADFAELSDESRREVREFIAFKRQQAERLEGRKPKWPSQAREDAPERREQDRETPENPENPATPEVDAQGPASPGSQDGEAS